MILIPDSHERIPNSFLFPSSLNILENLLLMYQYPNVSHNYPFITTTAATTTNDRHFVHGECVNSGM